MPEEVRHITVNGRYKVQFEKAASANKIDGFKCEVNGDDRQKTLDDAIGLYYDLTRTVEANKPVQPPAKEK